MPICKQIVTNDETTRQRRKPLDCAEQILVEALVQERWGLYLQQTYGVIVGLPALPRRF